MLWSGHTPFPMRRKLATLHVILNEREALFTVVYLGICCTESPFLSFKMKIQGILALLLEYLFRNTDPHWHAGV